jgi:hypothetical protein
VRSLADSLYRRVDWIWAQPRLTSAREGAMGSRVSMGWRPESGFLDVSWRGDDEAMLLCVLALGSPTHPVGGDVWPLWTSSYEWRSYYGRQQVSVAPLFGHQYSQLFVDFRGIQDAYMRGKGIDYFENPRRATRSQRDYAIENRGRWAGYGASVRSLSASDGPGGTTLVPPALGGAPCVFYGYAARGAAATDVRDDGTLTATAAGGSVPFAPEIAVPALRAMRSLGNGAASGETASSTPSTRPSPASPACPAGSTSTTSASTRDRSWRWSRTTGRSCCGGTCGARPTSGAGWNAQGSREDG